MSSEIDGSAMTNQTDELEFRKASLRKRMVQSLEQSLDERVDRFLAVGHQNMVAKHHFTDASQECLECFTHGHFIAAIMLAQAVAEGVLKLMVERNELTIEKPNRDKRLEALLESDFINEAVAEAFKRIFRSFRNDYHHMNPPVGSINHTELAERNIGDLTEIERYVFGYDIEDGRASPHFAQYWDIGDDGMMPVHVNFQ